MADEHKSVKQPLSYQGTTPEGGVGDCATPQSVPDIPTKTKKPKYTFRDLYGMAPNATNGVPSDEFIRNLRDNEW
ncbi:MAG: hypothetical protein HAW65_01330 [Alphaproteobacteria bacterium]|nr:hypothetical protein [Alphaproteobacteria bacterium]MBE8219937.1 hypothetical protein [Alphaproteobacteria bacterium]